MKKIFNSIKKLKETQCEDDEDAEQAEVLQEEDMGGESEKMPWARAEERTMVFPREKKERVATRAERELPEEVLERLRGKAKGMRRWVKAKKAGVTQEVVDEILNRWRNGEELVMVRFVEPLARNMDRAMEILEIKTGGLVVWRKRDALVLHRGYNQLAAKPFQGPSPFVREKAKVTLMDRALHEGVGSMDESLYVREANRLLDGLGPRFIDWWWRKPLPVDADLLPEVVPGFKPPFRLCPPEERPKLRDDELTYLRKLAQSLPTHFALGKNTKLQGLAAAIMKLWEKSVIAKIAVKIGIPHTNNEQMAEELKKLMNAASHRRSPHITEQVLYHTL